MYHVVDALNGKQLWSIEGEAPGGQEFGDYDQKLRDAPPILRKIVHDWWGSGPNLKKFRLIHPKLCAEIDRLWEARPVELSWGPSGNAVFISAITDTPGRTAREEALRFFLILITNPNWEKVAGPCARCGKYFIKKRASQKVYCSRQCGNTATATAKTREQRQQEHADKLSRAARAAQKWAIARTKLDWKPWVSRKEPDITPKFLTRAVNSGELKEPVRQ